MGWGNFDRVPMIGGASPTTWSRVRFISFRRDSKFVGDIRASCLGAQASVRKSRPMDAHLREGGKEGGREGGRGREGEGGRDGRGGGGGGGGGWSDGERGGTE